MDNLIDAHYFNLPTQGNIYSIANLCFSNGINKSLIASLKRKIFLCEFQDEDYGKLTPIVREVPFMGIPNGAEIISVDAFNGSVEYDHFCVGVTIIKLNSEENIETFFNIYSSQDTNKLEEFNIDILSQHYFTVELNFVPYHLYHAEVTINGRKEIVWLLSGSDSKIHLFQKDLQSLTYYESDVGEFFPEFMNLPGIVLWLDVKYTDCTNSRRLSVFSTECGLAKLCFVDAINHTVLAEMSDQFDAPVANVALFTVGNQSLSKPNFLQLSNFKPDNNTPFNLVVVNTLQASVIYMDVINKGFADKYLLPESDKFDATLCTCVADIDMDGQMEILLGTYAQVLLIYKYINNNWILNGQKKFADPIHSIQYRDISGDGLKEVLVLTLSGIHILQHNPVETIKLFHERLQTFSVKFCDDNENGDTEDKFVS